MEKEKNNRLKTSLRAKILIIFLTIALIVLMFPKGESLESEVTVGSVWIQDDLIASTSFPVLKKQEQYEAEKRQAASKVFPFFVKNEEISIQKEIDLINYNKKIISLIDEELLLNNATQNSNKSILTEKSFVEFKKLRRNDSSNSQTDKKNLSYVLRLCSGILGTIYQRGVLDKYYSEIKRDSIYIKTGKSGIVTLNRDFFDPLSVQQFIKEYLEKNYSNDKELNQAIYEYANFFVVPDIIYDEILTQTAMEDAVNKVSPNIGIVNENERIIAKHDKISADAKMKIDSYRIAKAEESGLTDRITQLIGKSLHIILISIIFMIYIYLFREKIYTDNSKILILAIIILLISFQTFLIQQINVNAGIEYFILVPAGAMLLTIIFDSRIGFYGTIIIALICGALRSNDYVFTTTNILAGAVAAYTVRDIRYRSQIFRSFLFILAAYISAIFAFGLESFTSYNEMLYQSAFAFGNALFSPAITYGLIIFFEKFFKVTTDLTLLELTDFNRPLLKELASNAPGTFNHSMIIGSIVETAAEKINANPLQARVGAYYHDVGKITDPVFFVENQMDNYNVHENFTPEQSASHIADHVRKGIELAKKYNLPDEIINFIPMHHGTMVISYFYEKAKEKAVADEVINIDNFRYPGPKPNSKETALVMLGDACESAVRSLQEPDAKKVENVITNLINMRIDDGQLDDSPLTFEDIKLIKESFTNSLIGQHHKRIRYPRQNELEQETKLQLAKTESMQEEPENKSSDNNE